MSTTTHDAPSAGSYYVPHSSPWPIIGSVGLFVTMMGGANLLNGHAPTLLYCGLAVLIVMMIGWFNNVIRESQAGLYSPQMDRSFRWGMSWFIFSEVMFFAAFFGALFYARDYALPWLDGTSASKPMTHELLWPTFEERWPTNGPGRVGGPFEVMGPWGLPALNTLILLSSGATVTWAHWGLLKGNRRQLCLGLAATVGLGFLFVALQAVEYSHAYQHMNLTLGSGIYGSTFFMLTGFHGAHVTIGAIMLTVMLLRSLAGHFTPEHHFAFEAAAWYWHFVDVVWLGLFVFVYWF
ncbi:MAG: cytochrome c oxidase subunit 3 [Lysobacterales bacterium]|uniref:cytochrome c oxidase subunit 3 n=1 Tax=Plasticicumulans sp. TaxID=2307179 RepID=UPI000FB3D98F|nr:MAG: cytochrome c oxidase subunit 3 [Xanthomonadales bacterium]HMV38491.1 cytochrome c oxidase subunit 3 [Plasticicumulans sp.]HMW42593.1 cytochrome c oxidase subunit 3 [Plasticicumulans sp.]